MSESASNRADRPHCPDRSGRRAGSPQQEQQHRLVPRMNSTRQDTVRAVQERYILDAVRTPMGRYRGALAGVRPDDLAAHVVRAVVERNGGRPRADRRRLPGRRQPGRRGQPRRGPDGGAARRPARLGARRHRQPALRLRPGGRQQAARAVKLGEGDVYLAGGVESMSRAPWVVPSPSRASPRGEQTLYDTTLGWRMINPRMARAGLDRVDGRDRRERRRALRDQPRGPGRASRCAATQRAVAAAEDGRLRRGDRRRCEVPHEGEPIASSADEGPRARHLAGEAGEAEARVPARAARSPPATPRPLNDGAACLLIGSERAAEQLGLRAARPHRLLRRSPASTPPNGDRPGPGDVRKALTRAGLSSPTST